MASARPTSFTRITSGLTCRAAFVARSKHPIAYRYLRLIYFPVKFHVHDAFFGFELGDGVIITLPAIVTVSRVPDPGRSDAGQRWTMTLIRALHFRGLLAVQIATNELHDGGTHVRKEGAERKGRGRSETMLW